MEYKGIEIYYTDYDQFEGFKFSLNGSWFEFCAFKDENTELEVLIELMNERINHFLENPEHKDYKEDKEITGYYKRKRR